ncbi:hypothetical protein N7537_008712 [Penicillium hordei]|uniref:Uncharacterized protein n=1 Tax=Penicillium hordei TaxID=40994 RepID=A0AAD6E0Z3_9EURO|nr:uncharacterized protein N7537_008712 [Penicillium hordei]KAJ5598628.1 hypothetical protein N7537_008712 [Penicillium hordei]
MQRSRRNTVINANVSSTERTSKRTTKVPCLRTQTCILVAGGILRDYSIEGYNYDWHSKPIATEPGDSNLYRLKHLQTQIQNLHRTFQAYNHQIERSGSRRESVTITYTQFLEFSDATNSSNDGSSAIQMNEIASTMTQARKQRKHSQ